jgi:hypothetical protein
MNKKTSVRVSIAPALWAVLLWCVALISDHPTVIQFLSTHPTTKIVWALTVGVVILISLGMLLRWVCKGD